MMRACVKVSGYVSESAVIAPDFQRSPKAVHSGVWRDARFPQFTLVGPGGGWRGLVRDKFGGRVCESDPDVPEGSGSKDFCQTNPIIPKHPGIKIL